LYVRPNQIVVRRDPTLEGIAECSQCEALSLHRSSGHDDSRGRIDIPDPMCFDGHDRVQSSAYDDESSTSRGVTPGHDDVHQRLIDRDAPQAVIATRIRSIDSALRAAMEQRGDQELSTRWVG
jgi:hypothetical protein